LSGTSGKKGEIFDKKRVYFSMCHLERWESVDEHSTQSIINTNFILIAIMTTLCVTSRNDFLVYNTNLKKIEKWDSTELIRMFWCVPEKPIENISELYKLRLEFFDINSWIYDERRLVPRDIHNPSDRSEDQQTVNYKEASLMWTLRKGVRAQFLNNNPLLYKEVVAADEENRLQMQSRNQRLRESAEAKKKEQDAKNKKEAELKAKRASERLLKKNNDLSSTKKQSTTTNLNESYNEAKKTQQVVATNQFSLLSGNFNEQKISSVVFQNQQQQTYNNNNSSRSRNNNHNELQQLNSVRDNNIKANNIRSESRERRRRRSESRDRERRRRRDISEERRKDYDTKRALIELEMTAQMERRRLLEQDRERSIERKRFQRTFEEEEIREKNKRIAEERREQARIEAEERYLIRKREDEERAISRKRDEDSYEYEKSRRERLEKRRLDAEDRDEHLRLQERREDRAVSMLERKEDRSLNIDSIVYSRTQERSMIFEREKEADHKRNRENFYDRHTSETAFREIDNKYRFDERNIDRRNYH
jgi:hypothetical protein